MQNNILFRYIIERLLTLFATYILSITAMTDTKIITVTTTVIKISS